MTPEETRDRDGYLQAGVKIWEKIDSRMHEGAQGAATLNGAGIAGVIALMQRPGAVPIDFKVACVLFVIGVGSAVLAWIVALFGMHVGADISANAGRRLNVLAVSVGSFFFGVVFAVKAVLFSP